MPNEFSVGQIDHVELFVPDRYEAADWYRRALGLEIMRNLEELGGGRRRSLDDLR